VTLLQSLTGTRAWRTAYLLITDVTRMQGDSVCIAGQEGRTSLRLHEPGPDERWLRSIGGLAPGDQVSVPVKRPRQVHRPHLEDSDWNPSGLRKGERVPGDELAQRLFRTAVDSVENAFGRPELYSEAGNAAFRPGKGSRSLASLRASSVKLYPYGGGVRIDFRDSKTVWRRVPVEDLAVRTHQTRCRACASELPDLLASEFDCEQAVLRVGLGRRFQSDSSRLACWLQVNHVFPFEPQRRHFVYEPPRSSP